VIGIVDSELSDTRNSDRLGRGMSRIDCLVLDGRPIDLLLGLVRSKAVGMHSVEGGLRDTIHGLLLKYRKLGACGSGFKIPSS
jgi:hypothetical protein